MAQPWTCGVPWCQLGRRRGAQELRPQVPPKAHSPTASRRGRGLLLAPSPNPEATVCRSRPLPSLRTQCRDPAPFVRLSQLRSTPLSFLVSTPGCAGVNSVCLLVLAHSGHGMGAEATWSGDHGDSFHREQPPPVLGSGQRSLTSLSPHGPFPLSLSPSLSSSLPNCWRNDSSAQRREDAGVSEQQALSALLVLRHPLAWQAGQGSPAAP